MHLCCPQGLHQHPAAPRAHRDQCGVRAEDEDTEVQPARHDHLEPLGPEGKGAERLRGRRAPEHDLRQPWARVHPRHPAARPGIRS